MADSPRLFAVYLGGKATGASLEVHDVAFVTGKNIEDTFGELRRKWFGTPASLHVDSWIELSQVDGYSITLRSRVKKKRPGAPAESSTHGRSLFFINIGAYAAHRFGEDHHFFFFVCDNITAARKRAKVWIAKQKYHLPHVDNAIDIDAVLPINEVNGWSVKLTPAGGPELPLKITNVYWPIGKKK